MNIIANNISRGDCLKWNGKLYIVLGNPTHIKPGKGGAFIQVEMKEIRDHTKVNVRFRSDETVEKIVLERRKMQFLYKDNEGIHVMDQDSYEQLTIHPDLFGDQLPFLQEEMLISIEGYDDELILIHLPEKVVCTVEQCDPYIKGQTATSSYKPAILDNGVSIKVPQFIKIGDKILIRVADITYLQRAD